MAAIYQWLQGDEVVYTTTLYPIDITDYLQPSVTTNPYGNLSNYPVDYATAETTITLIEMEQILLSGDTGEDNVIGEAAVTLIEMDSLLQTGDTGEDSAIGEAAITYIELVDMLVICDTPDESLQLSCVTNATNSSLTIV